MERNEIIDRIGYIRVRAKLTQRALSYAVGMNPNYINRLESKRDFLPSLEVLLRIIEECGSTVEEFFYHDIANYKNDKDSVKKIQNLSDDMKNFMLECDPDILRLFIAVNEKMKK